jgi:hypothetical protein
MVPLQERLEGNLMGVAALPSKVRSLMVLSEQGGTTGGYPIQLYQLKICSEMGLHR